MRARFKYSEATTSSGFIGAGKSDPPEKKKKKSSTPIEKKAIYIYNKTGIQTEPRVNKMIVL